MRWEKSKLKLMFQSPHVCYSAALPKDQVVRKLPPNGGNRPAVISLAWRGCKTLFWIRMKTLSWPWWTPIIRNIINLDNREYLTWETWISRPGRHTHSPVLIPSFILDRHKVQEKSVRPPEIFPRDHDVSTFATITPLDIYKDASGQFPAVFVS